jgi:hypothetical protein
VNSPQGVLFVICRDLGREVLVERERDRLPSIACDGDEVVKSYGALAATFAKSFGLSICPLFSFESSDCEPQADATDLTLRFTPGSKHRVIVGQNLSGDIGTATSLRWCQAGEVEGNSSDQQALTLALQLAWDRLLKRTRRPLTRFEWFRPLIAELAMEERGVDLASASYHGGTESKAAFRFKSGGPSVWLKAASTADCTPKCVLRTLDALDVPHLPAVEGYVSHAREWDAILQQDVPGLSLDRDDRINSWTRAAEAIAETQLSTIGKEDHLSASGCPVWTLARLQKEASRLLAWLDIENFKQQRFLPAVISEATRDHLLSHLSSIGDLEIPHTLTRNSLSPMGVVTDFKGGTWFVGCEDAAVGFPFMWCCLFVEAAQQRFGASERLRALLVEAYCSVWRQRLSSIAIEGALKQVAFVRAIGKAVREAQLPAITAPDRFIQPDKHEWAFRLVQDGERARRVGDGLRKAMTLATRFSSAA